MARIGRSEQIIINEKDEESKISKIYYGYPDNPIQWPKCKHVELPAKYIDVTNYINKLKKECPTVNIPGGNYYSDHERSHFFQKDVDLKDLLAKPIYKEILIVREDGSERHYSKWKKLKICF
jgi:hypothetical protein|tara:strand:- start:1948 stop:2313 length:366 start_codon:yes stop_codon:yes gene_type:complete